MIHSSQPGTPKQDRRDLGTVATPLAGATSSLAPDHHGPRACYSILVGCQVRQCAATLQVEVPPSALGGDGQVLVRCGDCQTLLMVQLPDTLLPGPALFALAPSPATPLEMAPGSPSMPSTAADFSTGSGSSGPQPQLQLLQAETSLQSPLQQQQQQQVALGAAATGYTTKKQQQRVKEVAGLGFLHSVPDATAGPSRQGQQQLGPYSTAAGSMGPPAPRTDSPTVLLDCRDSRAAPAPHAAAVAPCCPAGHPHAATAASGAGGPAVLPYAPQGKPSCLRSLSHPFAAATAEPALAASGGRVCQSGANGGAAVSPGPGWLGAVEERSAPAGIRPAAVSYMAGPGPHPASHAQVHLKLSYADVLDKATRGVGADSPHALKLDHYWAAAPGSLSAGGEPVNAAVQCWTPQQPLNYRYQQAFLDSTQHYQSPGLSTPGASVTTSCNLPPPCTEGPTALSAAAAAAAAKRLTSEQSFYNPEPGAKRLRPSHSGPAVLLGPASLPPPGITSLAAEAVAAAHQVHLQAAAQGLSAEWPETRNAGAWRHSSCGRAQMQGHAAFMQRLPAGYDRWHPLAAAAAPPLAPSAPAISCPVGGGSHHPGLPAGASGTGHGKQHCATTALEAQLAPSSEAAGQAVAAAGGVDTSPPGWLHGPAVTTASTADGSCTSAMLGAGFQASAGSVAHHVAAAAGGAGCIAVDNPWQAVCRRAQLQQQQPPDATAATGHWTEASTTAGSTLPLAAIRGAVHPDQLAPAAAEADLDAAAAEVSAGMFTSMLQDAIAAEPAGPAASPTSSHPMAVTSTGSTSCTKKGSLFVGGGGSDSPAASGGTAGLAPLNIGQQCTGLEAATGLSAHGHPPAGWTAAGVGGAAAAPAPSGVSPQLWAQAPEVVRRKVLQRLHQEQMAAMLRLQQQQQQHHPQE